MIARTLTIALIAAVATGAAIVQQAPPEIAPVVARLVKTYDKAPDGQEYFYIRALTIEPRSGALWLAYGMENEPPVRINRNTGIAKVIGRSGSGPNEYRRTIAMQPGPQGDIGIWDTGRRTWLWVDSAGLHRRTWPVPTNNVNMTKVFTDTSGRVYLGQSEVAVRVDSAAGLRDTMRLPMPIPQAGRWAWSGSSGGGSVMYSTRVQFSVNVVWGVDRLGRMVAARTDSNFIIVRDGQREKRLLLPNWSDPLTAADRRFATQELDRFDSTARAEGGVLDGPRPAIPSLRPQIDGLLPEVNGGITIQRSRPCSRFPGWRAPITGAQAIGDIAKCTIVERFDASGLRLAPFTLGPNDQLRAIRADTAWITQTDSLGVTKILELVIPRR